MKLLGVNVDPLAGVRKRASAQGAARVSTAAAPAPQIDSAAQSVGAPAANGKPAAMNLL